MKFRTLKDIRKQVYSQCKDEAEKRLLEHLFRLEDEEAIKWVKDIRNSVPSTSQKKEISVVIQRVLLSISST